MINFKDFSGVEEGRFTISLDKNRAAVEMNEWIKNNEVSIVSIETIIQEHYFVCVRLWYKENEIP